MSPNEIKSKIHAATVAFNELVGMIGKVHSEADGARIDALFDKVQAFLDECQNNHDLDAHSHALRVQIAASGL